MYNIDGYKIKACADGTYRYVPVDPQTLKANPRFTAVGMEEEVSAVISRETLNRMDFERAFSDLARRVSALEYRVDCNTLYFESCEEIYAEDWRET